MEEMLKSMREQQQKQHENAKGFIEWAMKSSRTVEERVFTCPTCKMTKHQEGSQICSNGFHLDIQPGYKMVNGTIEKI
jgi:recombinational DNA repair protein RecR